MSLPFTRSLLAHASDETVTLAGDWHGDWGWGTEVVQKTAERGASLILHLGDFGVDSSNRGKKFLLKLDKACEEAGVDIWVTPGNHEDWARMERLWDNPKRRDHWGDRLPLDLGTNHIFILPRGYRFELNGVSFLSFGGAASVNFDWLSKGSNWWPEEMYSQDEVDEAARSGYADVLLVHESPDERYAVSNVRHVLSHNPMGFSIEGLSYSAVSRKRITNLAERVKPRLLAHGHMHTFGQRWITWPDSDQESTVLSLNEQRAATNLAILNLASFPESLRDL